MRIKSRVVCLLVLGVMFGEANACAVRYYSATQLKAKAKIVVQATIVSVHKPARTIFYTEYKYGIKVDLSIKGTSIKNSSFIFYTRYKVIKRGDLLVCPLQHGAGQEDSLKLNTSYKFYLRSAKDLEILYAEKIK